MLYETPIATTGLLYNFIFIKMKGPNKLNLNWTEKNTPDFARLVGGSSSVWTTGGLQ